MIKKFYSKEEFIDDDWNDFISIAKLLNQLEQEDNLSSYEIQKWTSSLVYDLLRKGSFVFYIKKHRKCIGVMISQPEEPFYISHLYIDKSHRRKGYALSLLEEAKKTAIELGKKSISLYVSYSNSEALSLYEKFGFIKDLLTIEWTVPFHYDDEKRMMSKTSIENNVTYSFHDDFSINLKKVFSYNSERKNGFITNIENRIKTDNKVILQSLFFNVRSKFHTIRYQIPFTEKENWNICNGKMTSLQMIYPL